VSVLQKLSSSSPTENKLARLSVASFLRASQIFAGSARSC
jgi:hypothetical protein